MLLSAIHSTVDRCSGWVHTRPNSRAFTHLPRAVTLGRATLHVAGLASKAQSQRDAIGDPPVVAFKGYLLAMAVSDVL